MGGINRYYVLFGLSGFAGLIYESLWTHYLKLFLGHAAYAQTLVLAIFMGGMAFGSWLCSRRTERWGNLLRGYAIAEAGIGVLALLFGASFDAIVNAAYTSVLPRLDSVSAAHSVKWALAALLILPQSILLGMTFPLMSGGLVRRYPTAPGSAIAMLYFTNSLGGAIGVLTSGFALIGWFGLPGTIALAGSINLVLALIVWRIAGGTTGQALRAAPKREAAGERPWRRLLLMVAFLTGTASFIYEIGWIRMLSLVLGSSTHAFELMLSAFILGLALGGLWIKRRIDDITQPWRFLAGVQIAMGVLALATLPLYGASFDLMRSLVTTLGKTETGYLIFNLSSHAIALAIMLPATFCAGTTLPLITYSLIKRGWGESSIGAVYGANTVGAIVGVLFAVHLGLPFLGLKGLLTAGAILDMLLGLLLLWWAGVFTGRTRALAVTTIVVAIAVSLASPISALKLASGVYRGGTLLDAEEFEVLFHRDGKTASVDLTRRRDGLVSIRTNGKVDAGINMAPGGPFFADEATMALLGALPAILHPQGKSVANIGLGSGLSTHVLLSAPNWNQVDTIEIEQAMRDAASGFRPRNERLFTDPRSRIHIEDAKTFFSSRNARYDVIVSEPSNPWVSGVSGLFSTEFYRLARNYLADDGLLVQWLQLYEIDTPLVLSVLKALSENFADYEIYAPNQGDLVIVAVKQGSVPEPSAIAFEYPELRRELSRVAINSLQDLMLHKAADRRLLSPLLDAYAIQANSDYYPVLDQNAARSRFMNLSALELLSHLMEPFPTRELFGVYSASWSRSSITPNEYFAPAETVRMAEMLRDAILQDGPRMPEGHGLAMVARSAATLTELFHDCVMPEHGDRMYELFGVAIKFVPYLSPHELDLIWAKLDAGPCYAQWTPYEQAWISFFKALSAREPGQTAALAEQLLEERRLLTPAREKYLVTAALLGYAAVGEQERARQVWAKHGQRAFPAPQPMLIRLLAAHSRLEGVAINPQAER